MYSQRMSSVVLAYKSATSARLDREPAKQNRSKQVKDAKQAEEELRKSSKCSPHGFALSFASLPLAALDW